MGNDIPQCCLLTCYRSCCLDRRWCRLALVRVEAAEPRPRAVRRLFALAMAGAFLAKSMRHRFSH